MSRRLYVGERDYLHGCGVVPDNLSSLRAIDWGEYEEKRSIWHGADSSCRYVQENAKLHSSVPICHECSAREDSIQTIETAQTTTARHVEEADYPSHHSTQLRRRRHETSTKSSIVLLLCRVFRNTKALVPRW